MEWSSGGSDKFNIGQQFQECLRPLLLQRYAQQKLISCRSINLQVQISLSQNGLQLQLAEDRYQAISMGRTG